jgi:hypothetical protein
VCVVDQGSAAGSVAPAGSAGSAGSVAPASSVPPAAEERELPTYARPGGKGLPLARSLAAAEGGQLTVASDGVGTRACLLLPAAGGAGGVASGAGPAEGAGAAGWAGRPSNSAL